METHKKAMDTSKETCDLLEKLSRDITETLNKIESRESYMNRALDVDINEYSMKNAQLTEVFSLFLHFFEYWAETSFELEYILCSVNRGQFRINFSMENFWLLERFHYLQNSFLWTEETNERYSLVVN